MMEKLKHTFCAVSITMVITSFLFGLAKSDEKKIEVFRSSKIVTVVVETDFFKSEFEKITTKLLSNYCGIQVSSIIQNQHNVLRIKVTGKRVKGNYKKATPIPGRTAAFKLSNLSFREQNSVYIPFGAKISGKIYLELDGKTILKQPFRVKTYAPKWGPGMYNIAELDGMPSEIYFNPDYWHPDTTSWKRDPFKVSIDVFIFPFLEVLGKVYGVKMLVSIMEDEDIAIIDEYNSHIRIHAARNLGKLKDRRGIEYLIMALNDKDLSIKNKAWHALYSITKENFYKNHDKWLNWWEGNKNNYQIL